MDKQESPESGGGHGAKSGSGRLMLLSLVLGVAGCYAFIVLIGWDAMFRLLPPQLWLALLWLPGLVVGVVSAARFVRNAGWRAGMSVLGLIAAWAILFSAILPVFEPGRRPTYQDPCLSNLKQLGLGMMQYVEDYDETFPPTANWNEALKPYIKSEAVFHCPLARNPNLPSYAMNWKLAGLTLKQIREPDKAVSLFDSVPGRNLAGGPGLLPAPPRHSGGDQFSFADGHARWFRRPDALKLSWDPKR